MGFGMSVHHALATAVTGLLGGVAGAAMTVLIGLQVMQEALSENKQDFAQMEVRFNAHVLESHNIHEKITSFMRKGPRFSRSQGLKQCLSIQELQTIVDPDEIELLECK